MRLSKSEFAELVKQALEDIPESLVAHMYNVAVIIEPVPDSRVRRDGDADDPTGSLGFYEGTPLTERSVEHGTRLPDRVTIYQRNIERICRTRAQIIQEIRTTVFHEVGHHFGLDEDDLAELGYE